MTDEERAKFMRMADSIDEEICAHCNEYPDYMIYPERMFSCTPFLCLAYWHYKRLKEEKRRTDNDST